MKISLVCVLTLFIVQQAFADVPGTRRFTEVIPSILYFGGSDNPNGRRNPLPEVALNSLCNKGFSEAVYLYDHNAVDVTKSCGGSEFNYQFIDWRNPEKIMKLIYNTYASNGGPTYVHCWNGVHASNAIAGVALKQFCGWSDKDAIAWWDAHSDNPGAGSDVRKWSVRRIQKYKVDSKMQLSASDKAKLCP